MRKLVRDQLNERLDENPILVWYDPGAALSTVFEEFTRPGLQKVDARASLLRARRDADAALRALLGHEPGTPKCIVLYVPASRPKGAESQARGVFESFAQIGRVFGADPADSLESLARRAMPSRTAEIDAICSGGRTMRFEELEALQATGSYPLLLHAFGTDDPIEVAALVLMEPDASRKKLAADGVHAEWRRLAASAFGASLPTERTEATRAFARWILFSEFWLDVDGSVPGRVAEVLHAPPAARDRVYRLCDRIRGAVAWRERYVQLANTVEDDLGLSALAEDAKTWGTRDTFSAEDRAVLRFIQAECLAERFESARECIAVRRDSLWRREPDRQPLWHVAERALELLVLARQMARPLSAPQRTTEEIVRAYVEPTSGAWRLDRAQRWFERAVVNCSDRVFLGPLVDEGRAAYARTAGRNQNEFFNAVERAGWPPSVDRQTSTFSAHVAPAMAAGTRTAYFLLDALRFEMGHDLAKALDALGRVTLRPAATVVPTTTPFGMAALLPGAERGFSAALLEGELVPTVQSEPLPDLDARRALLRRTYGDRVRDVRLLELFGDSDSRLARRVKDAELLVVRSDDIDGAGEHTDPIVAWRTMSQFLEDAAQAARRLVAAGVQRLVFASDHGHIFAPRDDGEDLRAPPGSWVLEKRRCRIGDAAGCADGVAVIRADRLGLGSAARDFAAASGFRTFGRGQSFAHEGLSLQECIVPIIVLEAAPSATKASGATVDVRYKDTKFTSRVISVRLTLQGGDLFEQELAVRLVVMADGKSVGEVADCDVRDPQTGLLHIKRGADVGVAIVIFPDFKGKEVELRVDPALGTGVALGRLRLRNACID